MIMSIVANILRKQINRVNCLPEWQIVRESGMVSWMHYLTEFDLHLVDLKFVPNTKRCADGFEGRR
jgi:hypothetical protein